MSILRHIRYSDHLANINYPQDDDNGKRIHKIIISAPRPSNFQKERMREEIIKGKIVDLLKRPRKMDECCNLAHGYSRDDDPYNFWTARVLCIYNYIGGNVTVDRNIEGFTIVL
jgi:hypothetical protein